MDECHNPYVINSMWCLKMKNSVTYNYNVLITGFDLYVFRKYCNAFISSFSNRYFRSTADGSLASYIFC